MSDKSIDHPCERCGKPAYAFQGSTGQRLCRNCLDFPGTIVGNFISREAHIDGREAAYVAFTEIKDGLRYDIERAVLAYIEASGLRVEIEGLRPVLSRRWVVHFRRAGTTEATHMLIEAESAEAAEELALQAWNTPFVSPVDGQVYPIDDYKSIDVEESTETGPVLLTWEELSP